VLNFTLAKPHDVWDDRWLA